MSRRAFHMRTVLPLFTFPYLLCYSSIEH
jgi:hypothetical protein